jgi:apolipoprotein N-acyltransferase
MICYESIFPALARHDVAAGAAWLVNQSDDSWYGASSAAPQGLMMARVRAIENRRWLLRDTDNGITAVIDPYGRVTASLPRFQAATLEAGFAPETRLTFYTRHGDWLPLLCAVMIVLAGIFTACGARVTPPPQERGAGA